MAKKPLDFKVIASGSDGNAVRIENIMIDCGISFKDMKEELYKVDTLLITHSHGDHIKANTFKSIRKDFPRIKVYANAHVAYQYDVDVVIGTATLNLTKKRVVIPFEGKHDVPVTGFVIKMRGFNILYMTDTNTVELPEEIPLDYLFLESNYDERKIREIGAQYKRASYDPRINSVTRHLSTQKCKEFYYLHRRSKESVLIELHKSNRFY